MSACMVGMVSRATLFLLLFVFSFPAEATRLIIRDALTARPLPQAEVLIHPMPDPKTNPWKADNHGHVTLTQTPKDDLSITVYTPGYHLLTLTDITPPLDSMVIDLWPLQDQLERATLTGTTTGFGKLEQDSFVDFSLNSTAPSLFCFLHMDMNLFLAPPSIIEIAKMDFDIPGNLDVPPQTEGWGYLNVDIAKPGYRLYPLANFPLTLFGLHVRVPLWKAINTLRTEEGVIDLLNKIEFKSVALAPKQRFQGNVTQDLDLQLTLMKKFTITPHLNNNGMEKIYASVLDISSEGKALVPMDIEILRPQGEEEREIPVTLQLNGVADYELPEGASELLVAVVGNFPDSLSTAPEKFEVTAQVTRKTIDQERYLPVPQPAIFARSGMRWSQRFVHPNKTTPTLQIHRLLVNEQTGLEWTIIMDPKRRQFRYPPFPNHWPRRKLKKENWSLMFLRTRRPMTPAVFNSHYLNDSISHGSFFTVP